MTVLSAMPCWFYDKKDLKRTPSIVEGLSLEQENRYRREGARFIINVGTKMGLRYDTMATGVVYFHRFYMFHSFRTFPRFITACCCLFLAGKVEETPKKCKDIIKVTKSFLTDRQFLQFGDDPKEEVMTLERILLQTIKFDLQVDHPYGHLLKYAKCLKGEKVKLEKMVQMAWTFINDSLCTTLSLQWEPEVIAIALMHLAGKLSKFEVTDWIGRTPKHSKWWDMYVQGMTIELLEDICHQVLDLYSTPVPETAPDSPPATPPSKSTILKVKPASPVIRTSSPVVSKTKEVPVGQPIPCVESGELKRKLESSELKRKLSKAALKKEMPEAKIPRLSNSASTSQSTSTASGPSSPKKSMQESETKRRSPESSEIKQPSIGHSIPTIETAYHTGLTGSSQPITTVPVMAEPIRTIITKPPAEPVHVQTNKTKKNPPPPPTFVVPEAVDNFYPEKHQSSSSRSSYSQNSQYMNPPNDPPLIQPPPPRPPPAQYENIYRPPPSLPVQPPPLPPPQAHYRPPPIHPMGQYPPPPAPLPQPSVMPNISLPPPNMPQMPPLPPSNVRNEHMHGAVANMAAPPLPSLSHGLARPRNASPLMSLPRPPPPRNYRPRPDVDSYGHDHRDEPERLPSPRLPMPIRGPPPRFMRGGPPPPHREGLPLPPPPHREGLPLPPPHREGLPLPPPHRDGPPPHHEYGHFDRERPPYRQPPQQQEPQYEREPPRDPYMEYDDFNNSRGPPQNQFEYDNMMRRRYPLEHHPQRNMERAPPPMLLNNRPRMESPTGIPPVRITGSSFDRFLE